MRLINADAFIQRLREASEGEDEATRELAAEIHDLVEIEATFYPIEAEPVRHGYWNIIEGMPTQCSVCGYYVKQKTYKYCPYCGARMEGVDE